MFGLFKKKKQDPVRDMLVRDLVKTIQLYHDDYTKLIGEYKRLSEMYSDLFKSHVKLSKCVINYLECGSSDTFQLLLKEHMIGEDIENMLKER